MQPRDGEYDLLIVGAGAAGLTTAIFAARSGPKLRIAALDGAARLGAKILVSGGGRCNVTHQSVTPDDYHGANRNRIKRVLAALPVPQTVAFFSELGVPLHVEDTGKLFPNSNKARTVVDALVGEAARRGVRLLTGRRVQAITAPGAAQQHFVIEAAGASPPTAESHAPRYSARAVALCTGGLSLPKTGSDGVGYALARALGHTIVAPVPALAPLVLDGTFHAPLSGVSHEAEITIQVAGEKPRRERGAVLWTHFGLSGPTAMNASRHWTRARQDARDAGGAFSATAVLSFLPGREFPAVEAELLAIQQRQPRSQLRSALAELLPARVAEALLAAVAVSPERPLAQLTREERRCVVHALLSWPLPIRDTRGYNYAEVTAGGVPLSEIDPATMESRCCAGLYLVGEILDVDGRIGGFNFQWAWAGGCAAGRAIAARLGAPG